MKQYFYSTIVNGLVTINTKMKSSEVLMAQQNMARSAIQYPSAKGNSCIVQMNQDLSWEIFWKVGDAIKGVDLLNDEPTRTAKL